jgi:FAD/FMN-containing dehydrogenase
MTHAVDGYSLALDFRITERNRERVWALAQEMNRLVVQAGGRFYYAKDSTLTRECLKEYLQEERVQKFLALKREVDPTCMLQTDLFRRIFIASE